MTTLILLAVIVCSSTCGDITVARAMKDVGGAADLTHPRHWPRVLKNAAFHPWLWVAISFMMLSFFCFLALLSREALSFAVPITAMSYAGGALGARFLLGEHLSAKRWAGVMLVCLGVALASLG